MRPRSSGGNFYNSEYRNFNRGFGHWNSKSVQNSQRQPSSQPICKGDLFIEAGRLAVEYLVSHGLLSANVVPGKQQNGTLKNNSEEIKDQRSSQEREFSPVNSQPVVVARKSSNDDDPRMDRKSSRERGRFGASRSYSSDWSREVGKAGSLPDRFMKDTAKVVDTDAHIPHSVETGSKDHRDDKPKDEMKKCHSDIDSELKMSSMPLTKDDKEPLKCSDMVDTFEERKDGTSIVEMKEETSRDELDIQQCEDKSGTPSKDDINLLELCTTAKVPTKARSSLTSKNLKNDTLMFSEEQSTSNIGDDSLDSTTNISVNVSSEIPSSNVIPSINCTATIQPENSFRDFVSFTDTAFSYEKKSGELPELGRHGSISEGRGEKRALEEENMGEGAKKAKQWLSVAQSDEYSQLSDLSENQSILPVSNDAVIHSYNSDNQENFAAVSLPLKGGVVSTVDQEEEKQLFSNSFDLNLMEASDMNDNHDTPTLLYPSISATTKDTSVGMDLSISNNGSLINAYNDCGSARKDIEIIDLECASLQGDKNMPVGSMEADITSMGTFPCNSQNVIVNPDGQDGYGFMISDFLGNEGHNCSSGPPPDINSLHNDIDLHHGEGMFSDDPIYMSLGEIPISLMRVWEPPAQERDPFGL